MSIDDIRKRLVGRRITASGIEESTGVIRDVVRSGPGLSVCVDGNGRDSWWLFERSAMNLLDTGIHHMKDFVTLCLDGRDGRTVI